MIDFQATWSYKWSFFRTQPHIFMYGLSVAAFMLQWQDWVFLTETIWPTKLKIFTTLPLERKFAAPDRELPVVYLRPGWRPFSVTVSVYIIWHILKVSFMSKAPRHRKTNRRDLCSQSSWDYRHTNTQSEKNLWEDVSTLAWGSWTRFPRRANSLSLKVNEFRCAWADAHAWMDSVWGGRVWKHAVFGEEWVVWGAWSTGREGLSCYETVWNICLCWAVYTWKQWQIIVLTKGWEVSFCRWLWITSIIFSPVKCSTNWEIDMDIEYSLAYQLYCW